MGSPLLFFLRGTVVGHLRVVRPPPPLLLSFRPLSTTTPPLLNKTGPSSPQLDTTFTNSKEAYRSKTTSELLRGLLVFQIVRWRVVSEHQITLMKLGHRILGKTLFEKVMQSTFYGHFVAGKDQVDIAPKIQRLRKYGVNAILDYSAEEDVEESTTDKKKMEEQQQRKMTKRELKKYTDGDSSPEDRKQMAVGRTYAYSDEKACDKNMDIFLNSIEAVKDSTDSTGFTAIKATAIVKPQLLVRISEAIERIHDFAESFTGVSGEHVQNQQISIDKLKKKLGKSSDPAFKEWLEAIEADSVGVIHFLPWMSLLTGKVSIRQALQMPNRTTGDLEKIVTITDEEAELFKNALNRFHRVFEAATAANVRVMVDAEQTYLQPAISRITVEMMRIYNTNRPIVYNTYQCYLRKAYHDLVTDLNQAERQNFFFGAKLVRGAYMEQERLRSSQMDYDDPINPSYEATTEMYEKCVEECMQRMKAYKDEGNNGKIKIMLATHNEDTIRFSIDRMKTYSLTPSDRVISFGQLYGMCDHISFPLGQSGYSAYKYVPYGPVDKVLPYLARRAQENGQLLGKTKKERKLMTEELRRRWRQGDWGHDPDK